MLIVGFKPFEALLVAINAKGLVSIVIGGCGATRLIGAFSIGKGRSRGERKVMELLPGSTLLAKSIAADGGIQRSSALSSVLQVFPQSTQIMDGDGRDGDAPELAFAKCSRERADVS